MADFVTVDSDGNWIKKKSYTIEYQLLSNGGLITKLSGETKLLWTKAEMAAYTDADWTAGAEPTIPSIGISDDYLEVTNVVIGEGEGDRLIEVTFAVKDILIPPEPMYLFWAKMSTGGYTGYPIIGGRLYDNGHPEYGAFVYITGNHAAEFSAAYARIKESTCNDNLDYTTGTPDPNETIYNAGKNRTEIYIGTDRGGPLLSCETYDGLITKTGDLMFPG